MTPAQRSSLTVWAIVGAALAVGAGLWVVALSWQLVVAIAAASVALLQAWPRWWRVTGGERGPGGEP